MSRIAFVGTGIMGTPMVKNLIHAGHEVTVWNRTQSKLDPLIEIGAKVCTDLSQLGVDQDILICILSDGKTCDDIIFSPQGAISGLKQDSIVIVMSSIPVETARKQEQKCHALGLRYLDAPVSGGEKGAINATLAIMVGGKPSVFDSAHSVLSVLGRPVRVGEAGCGELAKLVNQMIVASTIATVSEALLMAQQGGADAAKVLEALSGGFADSAILQQHGRRMLELNFGPGGKAVTQLKDTHTAVEHAKSLNLNLPVLNLVDSLFEQMVNHGDGELDHAGLFREIKRLNQIEDK